MTFICFVQISLLNYSVIILFQADSSVLNPSMQVIWVLVGLLSVLVTNAAAQSCPANLNSEAQFVLYGDIMFSQEVLQTILVDTNLTFFKEVLGFDDAEIEQETQNAFQFFNERFGLDFSQSEPNELGIRFFENATIQPNRQPRGIFITFNRWLLTGNTRSKCFIATIGGYLVNFIGEQTLRGTYGGEEGIQVSTDRVLGYDYLSISIPRCDPVVIQRKTPIPNEGAQIGLFVLFFELSHPTLGQGAQQGFFQTERSTENGTSIFRRSGSSVLTFPPNVLSFN